MAGVAHAAADEERTHGGFRQKSRSHVIGQVGVGGHAIHLANFIGSHGVDFFASERRKREQVVHKARAEQIVLVALKFVIAVGAEAQRSSQEKLRDSRTLCAKR